MKNNILSSTPNNQKKELTSNSIIKSAFEKAKKTGEGVNSGYTTDTSKKLIKYFIKKNLNLYLSLSLLLRYLSKHNRRNECCL